jgi:hypothetical protein
MSEAYFEINNKQYLVYFELMDVLWVERTLNIELDLEDVWMIEFSRSGIIADKSIGGNRAGITGTGDAYEVFSTVLKCINEFKSRRNTDAFIFTASEPSRISLYNRMSNKLGRDVQTVKSKAGVYFIVKV